MTLALRGLPDKDLEEWCAILRGAVQAVQEERTDIPKIRERLQKQTGKDLAKTFSKKPHDD